MTPRIFWGGEDRLKLFNECLLFFEFIFDLEPFEVGKLGKAHFQNGGRLTLRELESLNETIPRLIPILRLFDRLDDGIDVI